MLFIPDNLKRRILTLNTSPLKAGVLLLNKSLMDSVNYSFLLNNLYFVYERLAKCYLMKSGAALEM